MGYVFGGISWWEQRGNARLEFILSVRPGRESVLSLVELECPLLSWRIRCTCSTTRLASSFLQVQGNLPKCSLGKPAALSRSLSIWFHSTVRALAFSRKSYWGWVCKQTRTHVEGSFSLVMRCDIKSHFRMIGIWLIFHECKCHHEICVYFVCVNSLFIYVWETWILLLQIWMSLYIFLWQCVFTFEINAEKCSLWQMQVFFKTISHFTF